VKMVFTCMTLS